MKQVFFAMLPDVVLLDVAGAAEVEGVFSSGNLPDRGLSGEDRGVAEADDGQNGAECKGVGHKSAGILRERLLVSTAFSHADQPVLQRL